MSCDTSRRRFIKTVLMASGAVFTDWNGLAAAGAQRRATNGGGAIAERVESQRFKVAHDILRDDSRRLSFPPASESFDCVVLGAGVSGLAAAWRLMKEGKSFVVLDSEPVAGGAARAGTRAGKLFPIGAVYFITWDGVYKQIYDDIGLKPVLTGEDALWFGNGGIYPDWWNDANLATLPLSANDKDAFKKYRDALIKLDPLPDYPLYGASQTMIAQYDSISARQWLSQFGSDALISWMDLYARSSCGAPIGDVNAYCFLNFYESEFGNEFGLPRYTYPGGLAGTVEKFVQRIGGERVRRNALALRLTNVRGGVEAGYLDADGAPRAIRARTAICAMQKKIAQTLIPELPAAQRNAFAEMRYAPYITVNLFCNGPLFPRRGYDIWFKDPNFVLTDMVDGSLAPDTEAGTVGRTSGEFDYCVFCPQPESNRANLQDERYLAAYAQRVAQAVAAQVPHAMEIIEEMRVFSWGHAMVIPFTGSHARLFPAVSEPCGGIFFANTDNDISPATESGVINGHWAAERAIKYMA